MTRFVRIRYNVSQSLRNLDTIIVVSGSGLSCIKRELSEKMINDFVQSKAISRVIGPKMLQSENYYYALYNNYAVKIVRFHLKRGI